MCSERAASSPSESAVIVTTVVECMRYCVVHHTDEDEDQKKLRTMLISQKVCWLFLLRETLLLSLSILHCLICLFALQLLPLLEKALGSASLRNGPLFLVVTEMLWSWENKAGLHGDEANSKKEIFQLLLADFWEELGILLVRYVDTEEADPQHLEGIATLLQVSSIVLP